MDVGMDKISTKDAADISAQSSLGGQRWPAREKLHLVLEDECLGVVRCSISRNRYGDHRLAFQHLRLGIWVVTTPFTGIASVGNDFRRRLSVPL